MFGRNGEPVPARARGFDGPNFWHPSVVGPILYHSVSIGELRMSLPQMNPWPTNASLGDAVSSSMNVGGNWDFWGKSGDAGETHFVQVITNPSTAAQTIDIGFDAAIAASHITTVRNEAAATALTHRRGDQWTGTETVYIRIGALSTQEVHISP